MTQRTYTLTLKGELIAMAILAEQQAVLSALDRYISVMQPYAHDGDRTKECQMQFVNDMKNAQRSSGHRYLENIRRRRLASNAAAFLVAAVNAIRQV